MRCVFLLALAGCASPPPEHYVYTIDHLQPHAASELGGVLDSMSSLGVDTEGATARAIASGTLAIGLDVDVADGTYAVAPGTVSLAIAVVDPIFVVPLDVVDARVELASVDDAAIESGSVTGSVTADNLASDLYPALAAGFTELAHRDCDAACSCRPGSDGARLVGLFDDPARDCTITSDELAGNSFFAALFAGSSLSFAADFSATRRN